MTDANDAGSHDTGSPDAGSPGEDGYDGPAELVLDGEAPVSIEVSLRGHFDPISGSYRWYGLRRRRCRRRPARRIRRPLARPAHARTARSRPACPMSTRGGRPRVEGFGSAPFEVLNTVAD